MGGPNSYFLFPETVLTGEDNVVDVQPDTAGEYPGQGIPERDNRGGLTVVQTGTYKSGTSTSARKVNYRIADAGSNFAGGSYAWKPATNLVTRTNTMGLVGTTAITANTLSLNGVFIETSANLDSYSYDGASYSALAKSIAINRSTDLHGVTATCGTTSNTAIGAVQAGTIVAGDIKIENIDIRQGSDIVVTASDGTGTLLSAINALTSQTGVTATIDAGVVTLTRTDIAGANMKVVTTANGSSILNISASPVNTNDTSSITLSHETHIDIQGGANAILGNGFTDTIYQTREWYGYDDMRYFYAEHGGFLNDPGYGACAVFCKAKNRELIYVAKETTEAGDAKLFCRYHDARDEYDDWTEVEILLDKEYATGFGAHTAALQVCEMRDGTLRMLTRQNGRDWTLWQSSDGLVWNRINDNILRRFTTKLMQQSLWPRMDASGDFLRIAWMDYTAAGGGGHAESTYYLRTIVSSDGGASWTEPTFSLSPYSISQDGMGSDYFIWTMAALGDESGTFYLHFGTGSNIRTFYARRLDGWADTTITIGTSAWNTTTGGAHLAAVRGPDYYYLLFQYKQPSGSPSNPYISGGASMSIYEIDPSEPLTSNSWRDLGISGQWDGTCKFQPALMNLINCGDYIAMFSGAVDNDTSSSTLEASVTCYLRFGKWDKKPIKETYPEPFSTAAIEALVTLAHQPARTLYRLSWNACFGAPAPTSNAYVSSDSPWTRTRNATTQGWNSWRMQLSDQNILGDYAIYEFDDTANVTSNSAPFWGVTNSINEIAGSCIECEMRVSQIGEGTHTTEVVFFRVKSFWRFLGTNADPIDISLLFNSTGFVVWDNIAGSQVGSAVTGLTMSEFHLFRMVFRPYPTTYKSRCQIWYKQIGDFGENEWGYTPVFTPSTGDGTPVQSISFGHGNVAYGPTKRITQWRRVAVIPFTDCNQLEDQDVRWPDEQRGHLVTQNPVLINNNTYARWGGGGGMDNDYFSGSPDSNYQSSNIFIDSPRIEWRSEAHGTTPTEGQITLVANPNDPNARIRFGGIAFFKTNFLQTLIEWSDDGSSWTTMDTVHTKLISSTIVSIKEKCLILSLPSKAHPILGQMQSNDNRDYYLRLDSAGESEGVPNLTFKIDKIDYIDSEKFAVYLDTNKNLKTFGLTAGGEGDTITIHSDQWVFRPTASDLFQPQQYGVRYLRFTTTGSHESAEGYWKAGRIVIGPVLDLNVPLEWTMENNQQPNITKYRTRSAIQWAFVEGPPQRIIGGRIVGDVYGQERLKLRYALNKYSQYEKTSCVLVKDNTSNYASSNTNNYLRQNCHPENVILGRITNGSTLNQIAWYQDDDGNWRQAGDVEIQFTEEI